MVTKDTTNAQRQAAARKRLIEEGGRRLSLAIPGPLNARLSAESKRTGESPSAVVMRLLQNNLPDAE